MFSNIFVIFSILLVLLLILILYSPFRLTLWISKIYTQVLWCLPTDELLRPRDPKYIALTIDDTPTPNTTLAILDVLNKYQAKATFFCLGGTQTNELESIVAQGHTLGNHTLYDRPSYKLSNTELEDEIKKTDTIIENAYKAANKTRGTKWFRPGSGWFTQSLLKTAKDLGYLTVLGSCYPFDAHIPNSWLISLLIRFKLYWSNGSEGHIMILHDRPYTIKVLNTILPWLIDRGYKVISLDELYEMRKRS